MSRLKIIFIKVTIFLGFIIASQAKCLLDDSKCITVLANGYAEKLKTGIPEMGLPAFEPLELDNTTFEIAVRDAIRVRFNVWDVKLHNLTTWKITSVHGMKGVLTEETYKIVATLNCENFLLTGRYNASGQIAGKPVVGEGNFQVYGDDIDHLQVIEFGREKKDNLDYLKILGLFDASDVNNYSINLENFTIDNELEVFNDEKRQSPFAALFLQSFGDSYKDKIIEVLNLLLGIVLMIS